MRSLVLLACAVLLAACADLLPDDAASDPSARDTTFDPSALSVWPAPARFGDLPPVNPVVGDLSFVEAFGRMPTAEDDGDLRTRVHLQWAHDQLAANTPPGLSPRQLEARARVIAVLQEYIEAAQFPRNEAVPGRAPRFVDDNGVHCAVAWLLEQTGEHQLVADIDARHEYDAVAAFDAPALMPWSIEQGVTVDELALVQPTYGWDPPQLHPHPPAQTVDDVLAEADGTVQWCMNSIGLLIRDTTITAQMTPNGVVFTATTTPWNATAVRCIENAVRSAQHGEVLMRDMVEVRFVANGAAPAPRRWSWDTVQALLDGDLAPQVDACRLGPLGQGGTWYVDVRVEGDGRVSRAEASPNDSVGQCLVEVVQRIPLGPEHAGQHELELRP